jgi:hypothetical protein
VDYITILIQNLKANFEGGHRNSFMNKTSTSYINKQGNNPFRISNTSTTSDYNFNRNSTVSDYFPNDKKK